MMCNVTTSTLCTFFIQTELYTCQLVGQTEAITTSETPGPQSYNLPVPMAVQRGEILGLEYMNVNPVPYETTQCDNSAKYMM